MIPEEIQSQEEIGYFLWRKDAMHAAQWVATRVSAQDNAEKIWPTSELSLHKKVRKLKNGFCWTRVQLTVFLTTTIWSEILLNAMTTKF